MKLLPKNGFVKATATVAGKLMAEAEIGFGIKEI
jgi:hypothetical protein